MEAHKLLTEKPADFPQCIEKARKAFATLYDHNIQQLMHVYPLDKKDKDGRAFWSLPKRPPAALEFDPKIELHQDMVASYACLVATMYKIPIPHENPRDRASKAAMAEIASKVAVEPFKLDEAKAQEIQSMVEKGDQKEEGDKEMADEESKKVDAQADEVQEAIQQYKETLGVIKENQEQVAKNVLFVNEFEKDEDSNFHIDFIYSLANLRAANYKLEHMDWI